MKEAIAGGTANGARLPVLIIGSGTQQLRRFPTKPPPH
jgi:hypothetical protein